MDGYYFVCLRRDDGRESRMLAHVVILTTFVGPRPKGYDTPIGWTQRDIAAAFGVSQPTICETINGNRWTSTDGGNTPGNSLDCQA